MTSLSYKDAGVDIEAGARLVDRIKPMARATHTPYVMGGIGAFAGLCRLPEGIVEPILVSGTDGVGTKLKIAFEVGVHETVGQDLVAMCVNDILTTGAAPLFFLDYLATSALDVDQGAAVIKGIARGCEMAGCALLGGETAELPGFYKTGEYDLAGFAVGVVAKAKLITGERVAPGTQLLGLRSSGLHSNGFSLARKALLEIAGRDLNAEVPVLGRRLADALLEPTVIYAEATKALLASVDPHALCHITGGGLIENLPRVLPDGCAIELDSGSWEVQPIFDLIAQDGQVTEDEMRRTFNMGIGFVALVSDADVPAATKALHDAGYSPSPIGRVVAADTPDVHFR